MRLYHLLPAKWGIEAIAKKRLKISRFSDLNDPFELLGANLRDKTERAAFGRWKGQLNETYGLVCLSKSWNSPLLWSHYGEKHHGLCLGFEVPSGKVVPVRYQKTRIQVENAALDEAKVMNFLSTKFIEWSYEKEVRVITNLTDEDSNDGNFYVNLDEGFELKEVIVGALSDVSRDALITEFGKAGLEASRISLIKARLAFKSFAIVRDKRGLR